MSQENVEVVRAMIERFNRDGFLPEELFDPEVELFNVRESAAARPLSRIRRPSTMAGRGSSRSLKRADTKSTTCATWTRPPGGPVFGRAGCAVGLLDRAQIWLQVSVRNERSGGRVPVG
jgi:hypothetical protein